MPHKNLDEVKASQYSTKVITPIMVAEITKAIQEVGEYGSVEVYIQNSTVTQITTRNIRKTI